MSTTQITVFRVLFHIVFWLNLNTNHAHNDSNGNDYQLTSTCSYKYVTNEPTVIFQQHWNCLLVEFRFFNKTKVQGYNRWAHTSIM